mmetsp:Transcript_5879/g.23240  ORF Transcript_5879/g.23240 Transcript_5879/m.23240 type:complete len:207 (-) Transcript_5879:463-1083(-)
MLRVRNEMDGVISLLPARVRRFSLASQHPPGGDDAHDARRADRTRRDVTIRPIRLEVWEGLAECVHTDDAHSHVRRIGLGEHGQIGARHTKLNQRAHAPMLHTHADATPPRGLDENAFLSDAVRSHEHEGSLFHRFRHRLRDDIRAVSYGFALWREGVLGRRVGRVEINAIAVAHCEQCGVDLKCRCVPNIPTVKEAPGGGACELN